MTPQQKRVLSASRAYNGTCAADFAAPNVCDQGKPIMRVPARIGELEKDYECVFEIVGWRGSTKCYRLVDGPEVEGGAGAGPTAGGGMLLLEASPALSTDVEREAGEPRSSEAAPVNASLSLSTEPRLFELPAGRPHYEDAA